MSRNMRGYTKMHIMVNMLYCNEHVPGLVKWSALSVCLHVLAAALTRLCDMVIPCSCAGIALDC